MLRAVGQWLTGVSAGHADLLHELGGFVVVLVHPRRAVAVAVFRAGGTAVDGRFLHARHADHLQLAAVTVVVTVRAHFHLECHGPGLRGREPQSVGRGAGSGTSGPGSGGRADFGGGEMRGRRSRGGYGFLEFGSDRVAVGFGLRGDGPGGRHQVGQIVAQPLFRGVLWEAQAALLQVELIGVALEMLEVTVRYRATCEKMRIRA